ncbi:alpha/beta hydrolase [Actinoplanes aureus]|uniref:Alpha/beta hydrolase n=1 Tax=Actinoplanes aureus TaxID=2792083 RepID=A0A931FYU4_9ACTN|nr:alpha/beta hydrolase [Actinoplanes aureus]MBG0564102.1 alpha/beta hydrolase [Actinoplanes aureus]
MADAVVIPGRMFGPGAPLTMYAGDVAERLGAQVHRHSWSEQPPTMFDPKLEDWVAGEVSPLLDTLGGRPLLIAKSLGTNAAVLAAERSMPAVWLTPLLHAPWVTTALRRAKAPFLLVGGTADESWNGKLARDLSRYVLEVDEADHGLYVPGPLTDSIAVLGLMVVAVREFLESINWPAR